MYLCSQSEDLNVFWILEKSLSAHSFGEECKLTRFLALIDQHYVLSLLDSFVVLYSLATREEQAWQVTWHLEIWFSIQDR